MIKKLFKKKLKIVIVNKKKSVLVKLFGTATIPKNEKDAFIEELSRLISKYQI